MTPEQIKARKDEFFNLRAHGHAANMTETYDEHGALVKMEIEHYLTCKRCEAERKWMPTGSR